MQWSDGPNLSLITCKIEGSKFLELMHLFDLALSPSSQDCRTLELEVQRGP